MLNEAQVIKQQDILAVLEFLDEVRNVIPGRWTNRFRCDGTNKLDIHGALDEVEKHSTELIYGIHKTTVKYKVRNYLNSVLEPGNIVLFNDAKDNTENNVLAFLNYCYDELRRKRWDKLG